jgi:hypothetical protein
MNVRGAAASGADQVGSATPGSIRESRVWSWRWPIGVADVADHFGHTNTHDNDTGCPEHKGTESAH